MRTTTFLYGVLEAGARLPWVLFLVLAACSDETKSSPLCLGPCVASGGTTQGGATQGGTTQGGTTQGGTTQPRGGEGGTAQGGRVATAGGALSQAGGAAGVPVDRASGGSFDPGFGGVTAGGASASSGGAANGAGSGGAGVENYTLIVETPKSGALVMGTTEVRGFAPGFMNVEAWDASHQKPPLAQAAPGANGAFTLRVDSSSLPAGSAHWTIWAWDTAPNVPPTRSASVPLDLTIGTASQGSGGSNNAGGAGSGGAPGSGGGTNQESVGVGSVDSPALGPPPSAADEIGGGAFTLVKNWNFGAAGTIRDIGELSAEFMYHDQFGTIGNGSNYGAITVAPNASTAIQGQPVEDAARPYREFTPDTMKAYVRPLSASQSSVSVSAHDAGNGSITAKWTLPSGGNRLGKDLLWETRARMPIAEAAYWFAIWTAGNKWDHGAEMDVLESFGTPNIYPPPAAFHVNSVGGSDTIDYASWPNGLDAAGVPDDQRDLRDWHTWSWLYRKDDSYTVYFDGHVVQSGTLHWTLGGTSSGELIDMNFLFDFGWGHTQIADVNISLPAKDFQITYEIDYSRVYLR